MTGGLMALWLHTLLLFPTPAFADEMQIMFFRPSTLDPAFGTVEVDVDVQAPEPVTVDLFVDGARVGSLSEPPFVWRVDVGNDNVTHTFKAVAVGRSGMTEIASVETPTVRVDEAVDVNLRQLYVTVSRGDRRVLDLRQGDFEINDAGTRESLVTFARGDVPITATLLIDASESMRGARFDGALRGARAFATGMRELDEAKMILFSDVVLAATPFTREAESLLDPLAGVEAGGNTSINDHLFMALRLLDARQGRRVVVLFTDGADLHSVLDMEDVLWSARRSQALVYWLRLDSGGGSEFSTAWRDAAGNKRQIELLEKAVKDSGGRIATLDGVEEIEPAFRDILRELREQYVLGYYPSADRDDGTWRNVSVRVSGGARVRTRGGYVDD